MTALAIAVSNNQPAELSEAKSRIAQLEAKVEQADFLLAEALQSSFDYNDMIKRMRMAQKTLKEALGDQRELMRLA